MSPAQPDPKRAAAAKMLKDGYVPELSGKLAGWSEKLPPRDHQKTAIAFLALTPKAFIFDVMGGGKCLDNRTNVLTDAGWVPVKDLEVGVHHVIGTDGNHHDLLGVYPQGEKEIVEVEFSDGTVAECCEDHLWTLNQWQSRMGQKDPETGKREYLGCVVYPKTETIKYFEDKMRHKSFGPKASARGNSRWWLPEHRGFEGSETELPIEPYAFGLLIGDGSFRGASQVKFTSADLELVESIQKSLPAVEVKKTGSRYDYYLNGAYREIIPALKEMGLQGRYSYEKHLPHEYLWSSRDQRLALLQGLMDSDGTPHKAGAEYSTSSPQLAQDVAHLVRSLGGVIRVTERYTHYTHNGERKRGRLSFRVCMTLDDQMFRLQRKLDKLSPYKPQRRRLVDIRRTGKVAPMTCIEVGSPDRLFLIDGFIPTHNTGTALGLLALMDGKGELEEYPGPRALVLTTAPNVRMSWAVDGFEKFVPNMAVVNGKLPKQKRLEVYNDPSWSVLLTNYESVREDIDWLSQLDFKVVILDEADVLKNSSALVTQAVKRITHNEKCERVVAMTGTPLTSKTLVGMYSLLDILGIAGEFAPNKTAFENYYHNFSYDKIWTKNKWGAPTERIVKTLKELKNVAEFKEKLAPYYLRRTKEQLATKMPEVLAVNKYLEPTTTQAKYYKQARQGFLKVGAGDPQELERQYDYLRKICVNTALVGGPDSSAKMDWLEEKLQGEWSEEKVVVFTNWLDSVALLEKRFKKKGIGFVTIQGSTSEKKREEAVLRFREDPEVQVLIGTRTLVRGLNLQIASCQCSIDLLFNPGEVEQIAGRIIRDGSEHEQCTIANLFIAGTIEHQLYKYVSSKQAVSDFVLEDSSEIFQQLTPKELYELIRS